ncbi:hypothetical protein [Fundidesulfovibrio putealis]|uniref:hypothetical protein n=1 Tax=Fundidesulfovibrio putealis TaxID=270496 RepID=UPI0004161B34|nr:hypothetical protein [Fundidesulfovibrio putealis]
MDISSIGASATASTYAAQSVDQARTTTATSSTATSSSGKDTVSLSTAAQELSKILAKGKGEAVPDEEESSDPIERIKKKIEELEKKIAQVEQSSVPDQTKQGVVKGLETELAALNQQLSQLMADASKAAAGGGTGGAAKLSGKVSTKI